MGKDTVKWVFHTLLLKVYIDAVFLKINLTVIPLPRFCLKEIIRNIDKHVHNSFNYNRQKENKCPTLMEWLNKLHPFHQIL